MHPSVLPLGCWAWAVAVVSGQRAPNVLIFMPDDLPFFGQEAPAAEADWPKYAQFDTPHIDRLTAEGVTFANGYTASSSCAPSRYALLTGRYPSR